MVGTIEALAPGETSEALTFAYTVTADDLTSADGDLDNTATATGNTSPDGSGNDVTDDGTDAIAFDGTIETLKVGTVADGTLDEAGDVVNYSITVENTGAVTVYNIDVTDPRAETAENPEGLVGTIEALEVLVNLLNNAAQAMGEKPDGKIEVRTRADDSNVYIDVSDNGKGMSTEILNQIFEPFFTTKGAGEGTGLGMAISQQIMEQHNGNIQAVSTEGVGTTFTLTLPIDNDLTEQSLAA